jgi:hypothetical protein
MANVFRFLVLTFAVVCILSLSQTDATEFPAPPKVYLFIFEKNFI